MIFNTLIWVSAVLFFVGIAVVGRDFYKKSIHIWLLSWLKGAWREKTDGPVHVLFCFVDHYEPQWGNPSREQEDWRVDRWLHEYPKMAGKHQDADGRYPVHTFFYPEEEYRKEHLDKLEFLCRNGFGEIEIHLHHDNDTTQGLKDKLASFVKTLHYAHGALPICPQTNKPLFAFIHGDWALDNSCKDGHGCGVNDELIALREAGCYADFTLPSAPSDAQTKKINSIYYAKDNPDKPKSHNTGRDVEVGGRPWGDLMLIQGPLGFNFKKRKWGLVPRIESGDVRGIQPPTPDRIDNWVDCGIHVQGRPEWTFVKIHTHGTQEQDIDTLLGDPVDQMFSHLESKYNDGKKYILHYVSAREMYNIAKAAEAGEAGNPGNYRDFVLAAPENCSPRQKDVRKQQTVSGQYG